MIRKIQSRLQDETGRWIVATAAIGIMTGVLMVLLGMEPRLVLVGCVVILVTAATWLILDVAAAADPVNWHNYQTAADGAARPDRRVQILKTRLRQPTRRRRTLGSAGTTWTDPAGPSDEIADSLAAVLDDHLVAARGVDRSLDAAAAAEALGPELTRFVTDPAARRSMTQRRTLARTIASIEEFTSSTDPS